METFVTKFKASADNQNLQPFGVFILSFSSSDTVKQVLIEPNDGTSIVAVVYNNNGEELSRKTLLPNNIYLPLPTGTSGYIAVPKYNIKRLGLENATLTKLNFIEFDALTHLIYLNMMSCANITDSLSNFKNASILKTLVTNGSGVKATTADVSRFNSIETLTTNTLFKGDIAELGELVTLKNLQFQSATEISGDINSLGKLIELTTLKGRQSAVKGNLEDLCEGLYNNGKGRTATSTLVCNLNLTGVKFHNSTSIVDSGETTITFTSSGISVSNGGSVVGTYDGSSWTYA